MKKLYLVLIAMIVAMTASAADVYLRGGMNSWGAVAAWKFSTTDNVNYTLEGVSIGAGVEFKVADASWGNINYGGVSKMEAGQEYTLTYNSSTNCSFAASFTGDITFNVNTKVFKATKTGEGPADNFSYAIHGCWDGSNWETKAMTKSGDAWTINDVVVSGAATFGVQKLNNGAQVNWLWGPTGTPAVSASTTINLVVEDGENGKNISIAAGTYNFSLNPTTNALTITKQGDGPVNPPTPGTKYSVSWDNTAMGWDAVYAYVWNGSKSVAEWPGTLMTKGTGNVWTYSFEADFEPANIIFNNGEGGSKTDDLVFENGKTYGVASGVVTYGLHGNWGGGDSWSTKNLTQSGDAWTISDVVVEAAATFGVKVSTDGVQTGWWSAAAGTSITGSTTINLLDAGGENISIAAGTYSFSLNPTTKVLTVTKQGDGPVNPPTPTTPDNLYMVGNVNGTGWDVTKAVAMTKSGSTFTLTNATIDDAGEGTGYFSFITLLGTAPDDWDTVNSSDRYGATTTDEEITFTGDATTATATLTKYPVNISASACPSFMVASGVYNVTVDFANSTVILTKVASGIEAIEAEAAEAVYYNLQGVRVAEPANGVYIRVCGNTATKVLVK